MAGIAELFKDSVIVDREGNHIDIPTRFVDKTVGIYFSAHWCPPCRGFTPKLAEFYNKHHTSKNFEIVFISCDNDEEEFKGYYAEMPWLALPFADRKKKRELKHKYGARTIPTLIIVDGNTGNIHTKAGKSKVSHDPEAKDLPWTEAAAN